MINQNLEDNSLDKEHLDASFNKWWPDLEEKIEEVLRENKEPQVKTSLSDREVIEKILKLSQISVDQGTNVSISVQEIRSFIQTYYDLIDHIIDYEISNDVISLLKDMYVHLSKILKISGHNTKKLKEHLDESLDLLNNG